MEWSKEILVPFQVKTFPVKDPPEITLTDSDLANLFRIKHNITQEWVGKLIMWVDSEWATRHGHKGKDARAIRRAAMNRVKEFKKAQKALNSASSRKAYHARRQRQTRTSAASTRSTRTSAESRRQAEDLREVEALKRRNTDLEAQVHKHAKEQVRTNMQLEQKICSLVTQAGQLLKRNWKQAEEIDKMASQLEALRVELDKRSLSDSDRRRRLDQRYSAAAARKREARDQQARIKRQREDQVLGSKYRLQQKCLQGEEELNLLMKKFERVQRDRDRLTDLYDYFVAREELQTGSNQLVVEDQADADWVSFMLY
jgi:hypothetical protein